jgi:hypothetical protein
MKVSSSRECDYTVLWEGGAVYGPCGAPLVMQRHQVGGWCTSCHAEVPCIVFGWGWDCDVTTL